MLNKRLRNIRRYKRGIGLALAVCMCINPVHVFGEEIEYFQEDKGEECQEIKELRTANSDTFLLENGSYEQVIYPDNKYYENDQGDYELIDNSLVEESETMDSEFGYTNKSNYFDANFSEGDECNISIEYDDTAVEFSPEDMQGNCAVEVGKQYDDFEQLASLENNSITYTDVYDNTDLVYEVGGESIKEYIVLKERTDQREFKFDFRLNNVIIKEDADGIYFVDDRGIEKYRLGELFAVDAERK